MSKRTIALAILLALLAAPVLAVTNELTGFGAVKLGSSVEEMKKVHPAMAPLGPTETLGSQAFVSEYLARYVLRGVEVPELKRKADVELRFWKDKLWVYIVYYAADDEKAVIEALTKRLGPPNGTNPQKPGWVGDTSTVFVETAKHWYAVSDNTISKDAQAWFITNLRQMGNAMAPASSAPTPAAPSPAATPAANATPATTPH